MAERIEMHIFGDVPERTLEEFKALVKAEMVIEREDKHALRKEWYLDDDRAFRVVADFENSEAMVHYFEALEARNYGERFDAVCQWTRVELYGDPSNAVREVFESAGASDKLQDFRHLDGFRT